MLQHRIVNGITTAIAAFTLMYSLTAIAQNAPKVSGYIKSDFSYVPSEDGDESETGVSNARLKVSGSVNDRTDYSILFDAVADNVLLDAFVTHKLTDALSFRIGQFKTPYSTDNLVGNARIAFMNRPYLKNDASPAFRDQGMVLTYDHSMFEAVAGMMNGAGMNRGDTNNNKSMALRVVGKVLPHLNISGNYYTGKNNPADDIRDEFINIGADGVMGPWEYSAEFAQKSHDTLTGNAYFAWVSYDFNLDSDFIKLLTPALRYENSDPDTDIDNNARSRITLGLTAHLAKKYADSIMINYEVREREKGEADDMFGIQYIVSF